MAVQAAQEVAEGLCPRCLAEGDVRTCMCMCSQFNSPVEVNWNYLDSSLLQKFWAKHEEDQIGMAPIADRILFFHRGITTVSWAERCIAQHIYRRTFAVYIFALTTLSCVFDLSLW